MEIQPVVTIVAKVVTITMMLIKTVQLIKLLLEANMGKLLVTMMTLVTIAKEVVVITKGNILSMIT